MGSPKSKEKSANSKGSKDKNSPKGEKGSDKGDDVPPVDENIQTDLSEICYLCGVSFSDSTALEAHLLLMDHRPPYDNNSQHCRSCKQIVCSMWTERHRCCSLKADYFRLNTCSVNIKDGPPYKCLFCRSRQFPSRNALMVHLLSYHRPDRKPGVCGLCDFAFKEPEAIQVNLPPPPADADEATRRKYEKDVKDAIDLRYCQYESAELPEGIEELDKHCLETHNILYELLARKVLKTETQLRVPYGCILCNQIYDSNVQFQAHVLCRHGIDEKVKENLRVCAMCCENRETDKLFNGHVVRRHEDDLHRLAKVWQNNELMMDAINAGQMCSTCWNIFDNNCDLQAHILTSHVGSNPLICGYCNFDFTTCENPIIAFRIFLNHEKNHAIPLHAQAIELKRMFDALPEPLPEDFSTEAIAALIAAADESAQGNSKSSKKSPKSNSKEKGGKSSKQKSSSKGKK